jgi:hypothetical protein
MVGVISPLKQAQTRGTASLFEVRAPDVRGSIKQFTFGALSSHDASNQLT